MFRGCKLGVLVKYYLYVSESWYTTINLNTEDQELDFDIHFYQIDNNNNNNNTFLLLETPIFNIIV